MASAKTSYLRGQGQTGAVFCSCTILFTAVFLLACSLVYAQQGTGKRNAVYVELSTRGPVYAVNYDRVFRQGDKLDYSFSAGFSIVRNAVAFPVGIHLITGDGDHHAGFSLTLIPYIDYNHQLVGGNKDQSDKYLYINPGLSYRYQPKTTSLFLKATIGPSVFLDPPSDDFWNMDPKLYAFGSLGVGISF